jgi:hypothetical protein
MTADQFSLKHVQNKLQNLATCYEIELPIYGVFMDNSLYIAIDSSGIVLQTEYGYLML